MNESHNFRETLHRIKQGDLQALDQLLTRSRPFLKVQAGQLLSFQLAARADASDVVQETQVQVWMQIHGFRGQSKKEWIAWLLRLLSGEAAKLHRHHCAAKRQMSREMSASKEVVIPVVKTSILEVLNREQRQRIVQAIDGLPGDMRDIVRQRVFERRTFDQISHDLGIKAGTARVNWTRALRILRHRITPAETQ